MSSVHQLAHVFLRGPSAHRWPELASQTRNHALAATGIGCDHTEGEELVAVIDDTQRDDVFVGAVITSRRYAWRNMTNRGEVRWCDLSRVSAERDVLVTALRCVMLDGTTIRVPPTSTDTTAFFDAIVKLRGLDRVVSVRPLPHGRQNARRLIIDRSQRHGRGQHHGSWLSVAAPNELARLFARLLGAPIVTRTHGELHICDFSLPPAWRSIGSTVASRKQADMVQAAGYTNPVEQIRIAAKPLWPGSAFVVHGINNGAPPAPLSATNPGLLARIFTELFPMEEQASPPSLRPSAPALSQPEALRLASSLRD